MMESSVMVERRRQMPAYKDRNGTWYAMIRYTDWRGEKKQKCQRGFPTK